MCVFGTDSGRNGRNAVGNRNFDRQNNWIKLKRKTEKTSCFFGFFIENFFVSIVQLSQRGYYLGVDEFFMSYNRSDRDMDKEIRIKRARGVLNRLRNAKREHQKSPFAGQSMDSILLDDSMDFFIVREKILATDFDTPRISDEEVLFHKLTEFYELIEPGWRASFNELNARQQRYGIDGVLHANQSVRTLLESVEKSDDDNASLVAINMYLANKLAHAFGMARDRLVEYELEKNNVRADVKEVSRIMKKYFKDKENGDYRSVERQKRKLCDLGVDDAILSSLEQEGLGEIISEEVRAFALKDAMMMTFINRMHEREQSSELSDEDLISYGKTIDEKEKDILVVDLPFFGQFSVHMQHPDTISSMSNTPYHKFVYSLESVMLTEEHSAEVEEDIDAIDILESSGMSEVEAIRTVARKRVQHDRALSAQIRDEEAKKYAHHVTLKSGRSKKTLDDLYDDR